MGVFEADYEERGCNMGFILASCFVMSVKMGRGLG
jgi:hypothetical protein